MKKLLVTLCLVLAQLGSIQACDVCGCGVGGYYSGMLPQYHKHFIGLRWRFSNFTSNIGHDVGKDMFSKEHYHSLELMGRFYLHRRVQLMAFVPLSYHTRISPIETNHLVGLGDLSVMVLYDIYNTSFLAEKEVKHNLLLGGGVKAPTGAFQRTDNQGVLLEPSFQLGTGSVDFLVSTIYTLRYKRWGLNTNATYKINLPNKDTYQFGNQLTASITTFFLHKIEAKEWGLMPTLGLLVEHANYNLKYQQKRINTGGNQLVATLGFDIYYKKIQLGLAYQQPVWQDLSEGLVKAGPRFMANINYLF